jgi:DNA-binding YbaB/EbfC family protein
LRPRLRLILKTGEAQGWMQGIKNLCSEYFMNINMLMQQAQRMQKEVESNIKKAKEELAQTEVHAEAGGGLVKVTMTCRNVVKRIEINPELLQDDADMIEDLIAAAMNDAARQAEAISDEKLKSANSGMGLPPGLSGLF